MGAWFDELCSPSLLAASAARVGKSTRATDGLAGLFGSHAMTAGAELAAALRADEQRLQPARLRWAQLDKRRELYDLAPADAILHHALATLLGKRLEPRYSDRLYSYRAGRSTWMALAALRRFVGAHRRDHADPRTRGLYVLRCDVHRYGDSIPVDAKAPIWDELAAALATTRTDPHWWLVEGLVRPTILRPGDDEASPRCGIPTGSPLAPVIANLYLMPVDEMLASGAGFSARFGDDLIVVETAADRVLAQEQRLAELLASRGLRLKPEKLVRTYWNGAGRASPHPAFLGDRAIVWLGCRVDFAGTLALPRDKLRDALSDVRARLGRTAALLTAAPRAERVRVLAAVVKETLAVRSPNATHHAAWLRGVVSDRAQLKQLDYLVALSIAELVSGREGPRALREVSYRELRDAGLPSLVVQRNRGIDIG